jgi:HEAT repeats
MRVALCLAAVLLLQDAPPPIGLVEVYGLRRVAEAPVRQAVGLKAGDAFPESDKEIIARVELVPGVAEARLNAVCCNDGRMVLFVGIRETGTTGMTFRPAPHGTVRLPEDIVKAGADFEQSFMAAITRGEAGEDRSRGYSLMNDPVTRAIQERFPALAARDLPLLRSVLHESSDASERALAAQVMGYAPDKASVVDDLVAAMQDSSAEVRNNAMRALALFAQYSQENPSAHLSVPSAPFVDLLNSIDWPDRNKSSAALLQLTEGRDPALLKELRDRALDSLIEMARWKSQGHAYMPFFILGRVAGMSEDAIKAAWERKDPETLVKAVRQSH